MSGRSRSAHTKPFCMGDNYINSLFKLLPCDLQKNDRLKLAISNLKARSSRDDTTAFKQAASASLRTSQCQAEDQFLKRNKELREDLMRSIHELKTNIKDVQQLIETQTQKLSAQNEQLDHLSNSVDEKITAINEDYKNVMLERTVKDALQVNMDLVNCVESFSRSCDPLKSDQVPVDENASTVTDEREVISACYTEGDKISESDSDTAGDEVNSNEVLSSYHDLAKKVRQKYDTVALDVNLETVPRKSEPQLVKAPTQIKNHPQLLLQPRLPNDLHSKQQRQQKLST